MAKKKREIKPHHKQSLESQIEDPDDLNYRIKNKEKKRRRAEEAENELLDSKISGRILKTAREQQEEIEAEDWEAERDTAHAGALKAVLQKIAKKAGGDDDDDEGSDGDFGGDAVAWRDSNELFSDRVNEKGEIDFSTEEKELIDPEDEKALKAFMPGVSSGEKTVLNLGDLLVAKLKEKQELVDAAAGDGGAFRSSEQDPAATLDAKVAEVYSGVGRLLSRFTSGKVPKAFKIIPSLKNWEDVLELTNPPAWSPHAVYEATRLFVSNLNAPLAQRFLSVVLLPRFRSELRATRKLHFAVFQALKKATYKPAAFYKGMLLPLCQSQSCTLLEAVVLSSILARVSIPVLHTGAALLRMASLPYQGTTSFFIRVLLDKKYALPYRVIDALVDHFVRFIDDDRTMPVVWHQCFLCFVQRYKDEIREEDVPLLRRLCSAQHHYKISPEVLREIDHGKSRGHAKHTAAAGARATAGTGAASNFALPHTAAPAVGSSFGSKHVTEDPRDMAAVIMMEDY